MKFKLSCLETNSRHTKFNVFDRRGANCGTIVILTDDVVEFVSKNWNGDVWWNGHLPRGLEVRPIDRSRGSL